MKMNKYDWSNVPKKVKWISTDADGMVCGFSEKPIKILNSLYEFWAGDEDDAGLNVISGVSNFVESYKGNWQDSLEERPNE